MVVSVKFLQVQSRRIGNVALLVEQQEGMKMGTTISVVLLSNVVLGESVTEKSAKDLKSVFPLKRAVGPSQEEGLGRDPE